MEIIENTRWFIKDNAISRSLMRFHIEIKVLSEENNIKCVLKVTDSNMKSIIFYFDTIEESISFIQNVVNSALSFKEIQEKYREIYKEEKNEKIIVKKRKIDS